jgi:hypothetical protein
MDVDETSNQGYQAGNDESRAAAQHVTSPVNIGLDTAAANSQHSQDGPQVNIDNAIDPLPSGFSAGGDNNNDFSEYSDP